MLSTPFRQYPKTNGSTLGVLLTKDISRFMMLAQFVGIVFGLAVAGSIFVNGAIDGVHKILPQMTSQDIQSLISGTVTHLLSIILILLIAVNQERLRVY